MKRHLQMGLFLALMLFCLGKATAQVEEKLIDVSYGADNKHKMDVYLPEHRNAKTPLVMIIHGGGWVMGDKKDDHYFQDSLLNHGIASVNINYRLLNDSTVNYKTMLADIDNAIALCMKNAGKWKISKKGFHLSGSSAGAYLSLLYGYTTKRKVLSMVVFCPPSDLSSTSILDQMEKSPSASVIKKLVGANYVKGESVDPEFVAASPAANISNIPLLIVHGTADKLVPFAQSAALDKQLEERGISHRLIAVEGAGHNVVSGAGPERRNMIFREMREYILKHN